MKKPDSLRAALVATVPALARDPQDLIIWVENGRIAAPMTASFAFAYSYRLNVLLLGYTGEQAWISVAILAWLRVNQPDLLQPGKDAVSFEVDFLDNKSVDLQFTLDLTESVATTRRPDGGFDMQFLPEPDPLFVDDLGAGGVAPVPPLSSLWFDGERLLPDAPLPG